MQDLIYVALIVALTGVAALFVWACNAIVGPDAAALAERPREASARQGSGRSHREEVQTA